MNYAGFLMRWSIVVATERKLLGKAQRLTCVGISSAVITCLTNVILLELTLFHLVMKRVVEERLVMIEGEEGGITMRNSSSR